MKKLILSMTGIILVGYAAMALSGSHLGRHDMHNPIERMLSHLDLTDEQRHQAEDILEDADVGDMRKNGKRMFHEMMEIDPDSENYLVEVESKAQAAADRIKVRIVEMAKIRKEIYQILTEEQKSELKGLLDKRKKRYGEYCEEDDD